MILPWLAPVSGKDAPYGADDEPQLERVLNPVLKVGNF